MERHAKNELEFTKELNLDQKKAVELMWRTSPRDAFYFVSCGRDCGKFDSAFAALATFLLYPKEFHNKYLPM